MGLAVSQSLRGIGKLAGSLVEDKDGLVCERDGRGVQLQYVRVFIGFLQFILLTPEAETAARPWSLAPEVPRSLRLYSRQRHRQCSRIGTQVDSVWSKKAWASLLSTKDLQSFPYSSALCRLRCSR